MYYAVSPSIVNLHRIGDFFSNMRAQTPAPSLVSQILGISYLSPAIVISDTILGGLCIAGMLVPRIMEELEQLAAIGGTSPCGLEILLLVLL